MQKGSRCSVCRATIRWQVGLIECLHKNRPRQEAEGADDILVKPTIRADPQSVHHEGRTWMSPTPSVVDFVGGSRSSVAHAGMGARRQMRRHARQLADRVDAAEATSFCAWFCASSSSQSSSPRTSSSIWLSSPYCPPSHKRWRFRNSAVANRHALHSDYYSTMRKTATPLNEWWIAGALAVIAAPTVSAGASRNDPSVGARA